MLRLECRQGEMTDGREVTMQPGGQFVARRLGEEIAEGRVHPDGRVMFHWGEGAISGAEVLGALGLAFRGTERVTRYWMDPRAESAS